ncbi:hypothetical protein CVT24_005416 [Panaeolus cyanescens]|uniref:Cytochrome P450 n=1 Tax=Panaeolus cyanescens TaxID=181874 RepID=A0A409Y8X4_9AGAR|nr:hypothetical protein CVT24_005416 [Panaeolus cyanescens]
MRPQLPAVTHVVSYLLSVSESYPYLSYAGGAVFVAIVTRWLAGRRRNPQGLPYPPGPRGLPFIGAYYKIPQKKPWAVYKEWSKKHGDLIFYKAMGHNYLIVQSLSRASDLFEKRSAIYSDRPPQPMAVDLMGWGFNMGWQPYGSWWHRHRKAFHEHFNVNAIEKYDPIQTKELHRFLDKLLRQPADFAVHVHKYIHKNRVLLKFGNANRHDSTAYSQELLRKPRMVSQFRVTTTTQMKLTSTFNVVAALIVSVSLVGATPTPEPNAAALRPITNSCNPPILCELRKRLFGE